MRAAPDPPTLRVEAVREPATVHHGLWGRAFRPFFLGLSVHAALVVPWWVCVWLGQLPAPSWLVPMWWHGHEMVFGFVSAAIAGFLLTASPVWTGERALAGRGLLALFLLWVLGRVALAVPAIPSPWLVAAADVAFLPAVALVVARTLRRSRQLRNHAIVGIVAALAIANGFMHAEALGLATGVAARGLRFAIDLVIVLILVIGGRITPAFTRNALRARGIEPSVRDRTWAGGAAIAAAGALALVTPVLGRVPWTGLLAAFAGVAAAVRVAGWKTSSILSDPLLGSLHAGAFWVAGGLLLVGASDLGAPIPASAGLHALTAGAMGTSILAVITRVALGHTGRALVLPRGAVWSYVLIHLAAVARVAATFLAADGQRVLLIASGIAWAAAFGWFAIRFWPVLTSPRPDGQSG